MVDEELELDAEYAEEEEAVDNANALTSGLVIGTSVMLVLAFLVMQMALGEHYGLGLFSD